MLSANPCATRTVKHQEERRAQRIGVLSLRRIGLLRSE